MIKINISKEELAEAKRLTIEFDKQKTYDKFKCSTNYRGLLGEMVLHRYLTEQNIPHEWIEFNKKGTNEPDFIINGINIDLKTTVCEGLWYQTPKFNIYISAQMERDESSMTIYGWSTKELMETAKESGVATRLHKSRHYPTMILSRKNLIPIEYLNIHKR